MLKVSHLVGCTPTVQKSFRSSEVDESGDDVDFMNCRFSTASESVGGGCACDL